MTRFSKVVTLVRETVSYEDDGSYSESEERRDVFANIYSKGSYAVAQARANGLRADSEIQVRSCDYDGQQVAIMDGSAHDVESSTDHGEFVRLVLRKRLSHD